MASDEPLVGIPDVTVDLHMPGNAVCRSVCTQGLPASRVDRPFRFGLLKIDEWVQNRIGNVQATKSSCSHDTLGRDRGHGEANG